MKIQSYFPPEADPPLAGNNISTLFPFYFHFISLFLFYFHFISFTGFSQKLNPDGTVDCTNPTEVIIGNDSIIMVTGGDYESYEPSPSPLVFYREIDKYTFWYKLIIATDCKIEFEIFPTKPTDNYDFFLYKNTETDFCKGIINRIILPVRANLYKNFPADRYTGLSPDSPVKEDTSRLKKYNYLFSNTYQEPLDVQAGEEYYLNVYHTLGEDCGHFLTIRCGGRELSVQAIHKNCFIPLDEELLLEKKELSSLEIMSKTDSGNFELPVLMNKKGGEVASGTKTPEVIKPTVNFIAYREIVRDLVKNKPLKAEIRIIDKETRKPIEVMFSDEYGKFELNLPEDKEYELTVSAVGYRDIKMPLKNVKELSHKGIVMEPVKKGERFIMDKIYFHPNTFAFRNEAYPEIDKLFDFLMRNEKAGIEIRGHTNGNHPIRREKAYAHLGEEWNFQGSSKKLSQKRSESVKSYLVKKGIDPVRMKTTGVGGDLPIINDPQTYRDALKNIRVEIEVVE